MFFLPFVPGNELQSCKHEKVKKKSNISDFEIQHLYIFLVEIIKKRKIQGAYPERTFLGVHMQKNSPAYVQPFWTQPLYGSSNWRKKK